MALSGTIFVYFASQNFNLPSGCGASVETCSSTDDGKERIFVTMTAGDGKVTESFISVEAQQRSDHG